MRSVLLLVSVGVTTGTLVLWGTLDLLLQGLTVASLGFVLVGLLPLLTVTYDVFGREEPTAWLFPDELAWFLLVCMASVVFAILVPFAVELFAGLPTVTILGFLLLPAFGVYAVYLLERLTGRDPKHVDAVSTPGGAESMLLTEDEDS